VPVITDLQPTQGRFRVVSEFEPAGDQPAAIAQLAEKVR
jgi:excinuclease ABC subunit B